MKKSCILSILLCAVILFMLVSCDSTSGEASLICNKKYYNAEWFDRANIESNDRYIVFYNDGTGEYCDGFGKDQVIRFKYILTEDSVHCFYDGGYVNGYNETNWNAWFGVREGVLCRENSNYVLQYINEDYLSQFPNFAS